MLCEKEDTIYNEALYSSLKLQLYQSIVVPTAQYASETWKATEKIMKKVDVFHNRCLRRILGVNWSDYISNEEILNRTEQKVMRDIVAERRLRLAGHVFRLPEERPANFSMTWVPYGGKRKRGRPKKTWRATLKDDLKALNISWDEAEEFNEHVFFKNMSC